MLGRLGKKPGSLAGAHKENRRARSTGRSASPVSCSSTGRMKRAAKVSGWADSRCADDWEIHPVYAVDVCRFNSTTNCRVIAKTRGNHFTRNWQRRKRRTTGKQRAELFTLTQRLDAGNGGQPRRIAMRSRHFALLLGVVLALALGFWLGRQAARASPRNRKIQIRSATFGEPSVKKRRTKGRVCSHAARNSRMTAMKTALETQTARGAAISTGGHAQD